MYGPLESNILSMPVFVKDLDLKKKLELFLFLWTLMSVIDFFNAGADEIYSACSVNCLFFLL